MTDNAQNNILITQDGQACLGEFGVTTSFPFFGIVAYELQTAQYMAPECVSWQLGGQEPNRHSKESDVYSLAVTSFSVCSPGVNNPPP